MVVSHLGYDIQKDKLANPPIPMLHSRYTHSIDFQMFSLDRQNARRTQAIRERLPGLIQHVLIVLGFLVLGAAPAPASTFVSKPQIVPLR